MQAVRVHAFGGPEAMKPEQVADLEPGPGEAVVKVEAAGINPVDTYIRSGMYATLPPLPYVPGMDAAGTVLALGEGAVDLAVGDRVYVAGTVGGGMTGCYAEQVIRPADELFPLPENVSFQAGAAVGVPYGTAYYGLFQRGGAEPGETVFIHGASGAVGTAAIQIARAHGLTVIGSAGSERGKALVLEQGAHHVLDHTKDGYLNELKALTGGEGPELILEMLANVNLAADLDAAARYGRIVVIGNRGSIEINPRAAMMKDLDVSGLALWNCPPEEIVAIHAALRAGLENGSLKPVIGRELPLAEAADGHVAVMQPGAYGKIVLLP